MKMNQDGICLNIGCGLDAPEGWENIDASPSLRLFKVPIVGRSILSVIGGPRWPKTAKYDDLVKGIRIKHGSCELIFASHILEHLSLSDFHVALGNIYLYLGPGGVFRLLVPDLEKYVANYIAQRSDSALAAKAAHEFMKTSDIGHSGNRNSLFQRLREAFGNSRHQWMWDEPSLSEALAQHGFRDIRKCQYGIWADPRFGAVESGDRHQNAICLEATKRMFEKSEVLKLG